MAKLRKWVAYRKIERPYTRWSKVRSKAFVKSRPGKKVIKYDMGDLIGAGKQFDLKLELISKDPAQIRTNAIESARITTLRKLESKLGRFGFYYRVKVVPHHAIRENALAAGAGADRLSTGMKHSFGKIIGTAGRVEVGSSMFELYLPRNLENFGRDVLNLASKKLPVRSTIVGTYKTAIKLTEEEIAKSKAAEIAANERAKKKAESDAAAAAATAAAAPAKEAPKK